jgi:hypothetical protein
LRKNTKDGDADMKLLCVLLTVLLLVTAGTVYAGVYEYVLPDLNGPSTGDKTTTLTYTGPAGAVNSLTIRIEGTVDVLGYVECLGNVEPDTSAWPLGPGSRMLKTGDTGYWTGSGQFLDLPGPFDDSWTHFTFNGGFSELATGDDIEVNLFFGPAALVGMCGPITSPTSGTMTRVTLSIDVSPAVPVETSTWGRIKCLYN